MRPFHQAINACFLALSVLVAWMSWHLKFYIGTEVGPGFMPFGVAVLLGGVSLLGLIRATTQPSEPRSADFFPSRIGRLRILAIILALVGTIVLLEPLGFIITTFAFLVFLPLALGRQNLIVTALVSIAGSFGVYFVFTSWLRVSLPVGVFGF